MGKKIFSGLIAAILFGLAASFSNAQQLPKTIKTQTDAGATALQELLNPSFKRLLPPDLNGSELNPFPYIKPLSGTTKFFLKFGANLIGNDRKMYPFYSLKNVWKYPGPTLRYPETVADYELFLEQYSRFNPGSN